MKTRKITSAVRTLGIMLLLFTGLSNLKAQLHTIDVYISQPGVEDCIYQNLGNANDIKETKNKNYEFKVIPNPNDGIFKVSIKKNELINEMTFIVTNLNGEYAFRKTFKYGSNKIDQNIDLSSLPPGIYFLHIQNNSINDAQKIIIQ